MAAAAYVCDFACFFSAMICFRLGHLKARVLCSPQFRHLLVWLGHCDHVCCVLAHSEQAVKFLS